MSHQPYDLREGLPHRKLRPGELYLDQDNVVCCVARCERCETFFGRRWPAAPLPRGYVPVMLCNPCVKDLQQRGGREGSVELLR